MKKRVIAGVLMAVVVAGTGVAQAGWFGNVMGSRRVAAYMPHEKNQPELFAEENGVIGYYGWATGITRNKFTGDAVTERTFWNSQAHSVFYAPKSHVVLALSSTKNGKPAHHAYRLTAEPMNQLLGAISAHYTDYRDYIEHPTPEGELKIKAYADVAAALASVEDRTQPHDVQFSQDEVNVPEEYAQKLAKLRENPQIADPRFTGRRNDAFGRFVRGEDMTKTVRGDDMFHPKATPKEIAAGAATKVQLYYVTAWLAAVADDYRPKSFQALKLKGITAQPSPKRMSELFLQQVAYATDADAAAGDPDAVHLGHVTISDGHVIVKDEKVAGGEGAQQDLEVELSDQVKGMMKIGLLASGDQIQFRVDGNKASFGFLQKTAQLEGRVKSFDTTTGQAEIEVLGTGEVVTFSTDSKKWARPTMVVKRAAQKEEVITFSTQNLVITKADKQR